MGSSVTQACRESVSGFAAVGLRNEHVHLLVVPELGAKIIRLQGLTRGRDWMWKRNQRTDLFTVPADAGFDTGPLLGADECIPTVAPCNWRGRQLPDHGEAWSQPWTLDESALAAGELVTRLALPISPLTIERSITLERDIVSLHYQLTSRSEQEEPYLWALHPMMPIVEGDHLELPDEVQQVRTELTLGDVRLGTRGDAWAWPSPITGIDLAELDLGGPDRAVKLFSQPLQHEGWARIVNDETHERLTFRFDPRELNTLGIWINRGGFGGYQHIAIEPTTGAPDSLTYAVDHWQRHTTLPAGATRTWTVTIQVEA